ncbi:hypothetical protein B0A49_07065 [Cryomyces minteri]|uniref:Uncharacterized protein n=1 Tax=Cryomyces minteri TaxID=331657 RepID=A0A4U0X1C7_9PEZI|nr:hypothetical protein B0A49_07065 [Cryomyces minteri]
MDPLHHLKLHSNPTNTTQAQADPAGSPPTYSSLYSTQSPAISSPDCECECNCSCHAYSSDDDDEDAMPTITIDATTRIHGSHNTIYTPPSANSGTITEAGRVAAALLATWASLSPSPLPAPAAAASTGTTTSVGGIGAARSMPAPDSTTGQGAKRRRLAVNLVVRCGVQIVGDANTLAPASVVVVRGPLGPAPIAPPLSTTPPTPTKMGRAVGGAAAARSASGAAGTKRKAEHTQDGA